MDNDDYLKEGFDAQTLNMSSIRGLLVKHSVEYPANAKKPQLVGLLHEHVLSKASKLRKEARKQRRAKADGRDIEQVGASGGGSGAAAGKAIGSRTRSQTPRTERTRAPQFGAKSGSKSEPKPGAEAPAAKPSSSSKKERLDKEARSEKEQRLDRKDKSDKKLKKPKIKKHKREEQTATAAGSTSPARAVGKASSVKRTTAKRKLSDAEGDVSADSGDDRMFTPQRVRVKQRPKKQHGGGGGEAVAEANFSDENPFQSSPEVARKRRRKAEAERTPMSALRKSQPSGVSFRVALPQKDEQSNEEEEEEDVVMDEEPPKPLFAVTEDASDEAMDEYEEEENQGSDGRARVSELVARYQQQQQQPRDARPRSPTVRIRDGLQPAAETPKPVAETPKPAVEASKPEPRLPKPRSEIPKPRSELPKPIVEVTRPITGDRLEQPKRFTMTPDALRELAAQQQQQHAEPSRRRTMATSGLPPVAPGIPVTRTDKHVGRERLAGEPAAEPPISSPSFEPTFEPSFEQAAREAHELQRRRVATLRQHVESAAAAAAPASDARTHSRRSSIASIASSVGEARGIPATPAAPEPKHTKQHGSWAVRLVWAAAIGAAALAWRTHEQFAVGFGSARAEYAALAPPRDSILAVPEPPADDAPFPLHAAYYARAARAWMAPVPLECPEHADCVPYTPIPAHAAHAGAALSSAA
ncbi:inner nuclear membrane protein enriched at telomere/subtelomere region, partial [Coemansia erecta]